MSRRVKQLGDEYQFLRSSLEKHMHRTFQASREAEEREALLAPSVGSMPSIIIDSYAKESDSLSRSSQMVLS
jgi:hypothetical protein